MNILRSPLVCAVTVWVAIQASALADGCFVPEKGIAKLPEIPAQRAIVAFRDGQETMVVESALEGQGAKFGWVIPVPSKPDVIEAASPGLLRSMAMGIQPHVVLRLNNAEGTTLFICASVFLCLLTWSIMRRLGASSRASKIGGFAALMFLPIVLTTMCVVAHSGGMVAPKPTAPAGPEMPAGVTVLERSRVGAYEVAVLAADDAAALYKWLESEGLAIPDILRPAADEYASRGWRFVTARLVTDGKGQAMPHPLRLSFKTEKAVYPMRFTGLSGRDLDLELFVIGDQAASAPGMKRMFCEKFVSVKVESALQHFFSKGTIGRQFRGDNSELTLGHPSLQPMMWDGCWVSKLKAKLGAKSLKDDLRVAWNEAGFEQQTVYSHSAAQQVAVIVGAILFTVLAGALLAFWALRRLKLWWAPLILVASVAVAWLAFHVVPDLLPQVETVALEGKGGAMSYRLYEMHSIMSYLGREDLSAPETAAASIRERARNWTNPFTGEPIREEDSPGNFTLEVGKEQLKFSFYDLGGTPITVTAPDQDKK